MASSVGLHARLTASTEKFEAGMKDVTTRLQKVENASKDTAKGMSLLAKIEIGKLLVGGLQKVGSMMTSAASNAKAFFDSTRQMVDGIGKMSQSTGIAAETLQVFGRVAETQGVSVGNLSGGMSRMNKRLAEAGQGFGEALKPLQAMGFNIDELLKMSPAEQFLAITNAISKLPTHGEKSAAAFKIFSDQGLALFPMFDGLEDKVKSTGKEMGELGQILSTNQVTAVEKMNDAFLNVFNTVQKIGAQVIGNLAPMIEQMTQDLLSFVKAFKFDGGTGGNAMADAITQALFEGAKVLAAVFDKLRDAFDSFMAGLEKFNKALYDIARVFGYEVSESSMGKVWEANIADIDSQLAALHKGIKNNNSNINNGLDTFGINASQLADRTKEVENLTQQRKNALGMMNKAEEEHLAEKRKATGSMGSLTDLVNEYEDRYKNATKGAGLKNFLTSITDATPAFDGFADAVGNTGVKALELLTDPSKMVASALKKTEQGFFDLLGPLGVTQKSIAGWANNLLGTTTVGDMFGEAGTKLVDTIGYLNNSFGTDLASGVSGAAQGFLDIMAPLGYTTDKIVAMGKAAEAEASYKEKLIGGQMSAWDKQEIKLAEQYISQGQNPFEVYRKMMVERNEKLAQVTKHFNALQEAADKTSSAMDGLAPSLTTITEGMPKAIDTAVEKFNEATSSIADYFGLGEGEEGEQFEEKDYTDTLGNSEGHLKDIATAMGGLGGLALARIF